MLFPLLLPEISIDDYVDRDKETRLGSLIADKSVNDQDEQIYIQEVINKLNQLDDVDIMFCLTADGATYTKPVFENTYYINTPDAGQRLKNLSDENILNSRRVVNKLKLSLSQIEHYKSAELHSRGEAPRAKTKGGY